eukprot:13316416-Alexandrium_andersonii.AAC.1
MPEMAPSGPVAGAGRVGGLLWVVKRRLKKVHRAKQPDPEVGIYRNWGSCGFDMQKLKTLLLARRFWILGPQQRESTTSIDAKPWSG